MTDQHRATPEQWAAIEAATQPRVVALGVTMGDTRTVLATALVELRDRVESLEELHKSVVDLNKRFSLDPLVDRVEALEARYETQHRAAILELANTVAKLGHRVEALEAQYETQRQATLAWGKDVDNHGRWIDDHLKRIMVLEAGQQPNYPEIPDSSPAPADSLVKRVELRMIQGAGDTWGETSSGVIREVAEWLRERYPADEAPEAAAVARILRNQANQ